MTTNYNDESSREWSKIWRKNLLRSSSTENDDENHHHELLRHSGMKNGKVEPTMKEFERSWRRQLTDDNSFLRQTSKRILRISPGEFEESGKILEKDLWVRAHTKDTPLNDLKVRLHRLN